MIYDMVLYMPTFSSHSYIDTQVAHLITSIDTKSDGFILEMWGMITNDTVLSSIIPSYLPNTKARIIAQLCSHYTTTLLYCINAKDLVRDRQLNPKYTPFETYITKDIENIQKSLPNTNTISCIITDLDVDFVPPHVRELTNTLTDLWYPTSHHYREQPVQTNTALTILISYVDIPDTIAICETVPLPSATLRRWSLPDLPTPLSLAYTASIADQEPQSHTLPSLSLLTDYLPTDDNTKKTLSDACHAYIQSRLSLYHKLLLSGHGEEETVQRCEELLKTPTSS